MEEIIKILIREKYKTYEKMWKKMAMDIRTDYDKKGTYGNSFMYKVMQGIKPIPIKMLKWIYKDLGITEDNIFNMLIDLKRIKDDKHTVPWKE